MCDGDDEKRKREGVRVCVDGERQQSGNKQKRRGGMQGNRSKTTNQTGRGAKQANHNRAAMGRFSWAADGTDVSLLMMSDAVG